jgi:hypothetical protein
MPPFPATKRISHLSAAFRTGSKFHPFTYTVGEGTFFLREKMQPEGEADYYTFTPPVCLNCMDRIVTILVSVYSPQDCGIFKNLNAY